MSCCSFALTTASFKQHRTRWPPKCSAITPAAAAGRSAQRAGSVAPSRCICPRAGFQSCSAGRRARMCCCVGEYAAAAWPQVCCLAGSGCCCGGPSLAHTHNKESSITLLQFGIAALDQPGVLLGPVVLHEWALGAAAAALASWESLTASVHVCACVSRTPPQNNQPV